MKKHTTKLIFLGAFFGMFLSLSLFFAPAPSVNATDGTEVVTNLHEILYAGEAYDISGELYNFYDFADENGDVWRIKDGETTPSRLYIGDEQCTIENYIH